MVLALLVGITPVLLAYLVPHHPPAPLVPRHPPAPRRRAPVAAQEAPALELEFPLPLSPAQKLQRAASFWVQVLPVIGSYLRLYSEFQVRERVLGECLDEEQCEVLWEDEHDKGAAVLSRAINDLKGFYVKTGQIIASRQDLFPRQYTDALSGLTDMLDPMPVELVRAVVKQELLHEGEAFEDVFSSFDVEPLGAASVAQVHRATLSAKYGGREVAVKVQRPAIEPKLLGDVANLKNLARWFRNNEAIPVDYYVVFSELEAQLADEFDFVKEAAAMERIGDLLASTIDGLPCAPPLLTPRPVAGLVTRRVLVMDYLRGEPLSRAVETMRARGIDPDGPEARLFGRRLLTALTEAFGRTILESGFFHADPHPGNIFVMDDGSIGLIDFGQVKQISGRARLTLAEVMLALAERRSDTDPDDLATISRLALELGVKLKPGSPAEGPAATAMWLFDGSATTLPGGFDTGELSPNSPVQVLQSFPQDLVLVGRSTVLIKGIAARLNVTWSLANQWAPIARKVLAPPSPLRAGGGGAGGKVRLRTVLAFFAQWLRGKVASAAMLLPAPLRRWLAAAALRRAERDAVVRDGV